MRVNQKIGCLLLILIMIGLDQWSKAWIAQHIAEGQLLTFGPYFNLRLAHNTGAAFSLFRHTDGTIGVGALWFLIILAFVVSVVIAWWLFIRNAALTSLRALSYALILSGAVGNLLDRLKQGYVIDFADFHIQSWHYATFNVADCAVVSGLLLILIFSIVDKESSR